MTDEERKRRAIGSLLRALPDALTAMQIARTLHQSKNRIYEKMKNGELPYYPVNGKCLIAKADLIEYILAHGDEAPTGRFRIGERRGGRR